MTLREALDTIARYCREHDCSLCPFVIVAKPAWGWRSCKLQANAPEDYDRIEVEE